MNYILGFLIFVVFILVLSIPFIIWENWQRKRKIEEAFAKRQELNKREFYERYFQQRDVPFFVVAAVIEAFEQELKADVSRLQPEDKYSDLSFKLVDNFLEYSKIPDILEEKLQIKLSEEEMERIESVEEMVNLAWQKVRER